MLSKAKLVVDDISTDGKYKGKDEEWWEEQGGTLLERILEKFAGSGRGVADTERITAEMMSGLTLRRKDAEEVVSNAAFAAFESHVAAAEFEKAKELLNTDTQSFYV